MATFLGLPTLTLRFCTTQVGCNPQLRFDNVGLQGNVFYQACILVVQELLFTQNTVRLLHSEREIV